MGLAKALLGVTPWEPSPHNDYQVNAPQACARRRRAVKSLGLKGDGRGYCGVVEPVIAY